MNNLPIEQRLENISSLVDRTFDSFFGTFEILPEQFIHLDNYNVIITKKEFKIVSNKVEAELFSYDIDNASLRYHKSELLPSIQVKLLSVNKYNVLPNNPVNDILESALYLRPPTIIYITKHEKYNLFSVKNMNMATLFLMRKINP